MISTKGRYAIRVMLDLAENDNGAYIPLKDIAERQEISKKYLEIIVKEMVQGGLVVGASGKGGGYKLVKPPKKYKIGEILELMEGPLNSVACLADHNFKCPRQKACQTLPMWEEYFDGLKSDIADMKNSGNRWGGASAAALFLQKFVKDVKWAHIDIAGTAFLEKPQKIFF